MDDATFNAHVQSVEPIHLQHKHMDSWTWAEAIAEWHQGDSEDDRVRRLAWLIPLSKENACAWDTVSAIAWRLLRNHEPLRRELEDWVADVLEDATKRPPANEKNRPRPTKPGNDPARNHMRDMTIEIAVNSLVESGLSPTRSNTKAGPPASADGGSACDVVGAVFGMNYKAVEKVWLKGKKSTSPVGRP